ncbi:hypothetical protein [Thaumasiovibrio sp. DFM-14]|uniref:hypothetical protein n=1 Tax=Thaumasiovibrio sp. DFM-14 TaxID=3384792 RepID=UPI0039A3BC5E
MTVDNDSKDIDAFLERYREIIVSERIPYVEVDTLIFGVMIPRNVYLGRYMYIDLSLEKVISPYWRKDCLVFSTHFEQGVFEVSLPLKSIVRLYPLDTDFAEPA